MIMTSEEQNNMLDLIKECQNLSAEKTDLMQEILETAKIIAIENAVLRIENEQLKRHLSIAEGAIQLLNQHKEKKFTGYPNSACKAHD